SEPVMAAVLAVAEMQPVTGTEALAAFVLGVEAVCRLSKAISAAPASGDIAWSQTGVTCGLGGSSADAARPRDDTPGGGHSGGRCVRHRRAARQHVHGSAASLCRPVGIARGAAGEGRLYSHAVGD